MVRKTQRQKNSEYQKERERVQKLYNSFKRRGYIDTKDKLTDDLGKFNIPSLTQIGKKATQAAISALKKITPEWMYKQFSYSDPRTGETVKGTEGRKIENKLRAEKAAETRKKDFLGWYAPMPRFDYVQELIGLVQGLPDYYYAGYNNKVYYTSHKAELISVAREHGYVNGKVNDSYQQWLKDNWGKIQGPLAFIEFAESDNPQIQQSYTELLNIVNTEIVTVKQQQSMDMSEDEDVSYYD